MHSLFSLKTFSAHNSWFSQPGVMVEQVEVSGTDCHQVLCPEEKQCLILLHQDTALMNLHVKSNPLALALGTLIPPCVHGIKHTRRTAFKNC